MHFINTFFLLKIIISIIYKMNLRISLFFLMFRLFLDILQEQYLINLDIYNIILLHYYIFLSK